MGEGIKHCRWCGQDKPLGEFYRHAQMADGHLNKCKACCLEYAARRLRADPDAAREYRNRMAATPERRASRNEAAKRWRAKHPERRRAHSAVSNAIRDGRLTRQPCEICGADKSEAHHEDYGKPLEVRWFCRRHHRAHEGRLVE